MYVIATSYNMTNVELVYQDFGGGDDGLEFGDYGGMEDVGVSGGWWCDGMYF